MLGIVDQITFNNDCIIDYLSIVATWVVTKLEQWHVSASTKMKHKPKCEQPAGPAALAGCSVPPAKCSAPLDHPSFPINH